MKEIINKLERAIERANIADEAWEAEPGSKAAEREFDRAYKAEYKAREALAAEIVKLTKDIEFKTALKMTYNPKPLNY